MLNALKTRQKARPDESTVVYVPAYNPDNKNDTVYIEIDGFHGMFKNSLSRKDYFIVSGNLTFKIDDADFKATQGDIISVPTNSIHSMEGKGSFFITCTPMYDPNTEETL